MLQVRLKTSILIYWSDLHACPISEQDIPTATGQIASGLLNRTMVPRGGIFHHQVRISTCTREKSESQGQIAIHTPRRISPFLFGLSLRFPLAPPSYLNVYLHTKIQHLMIEQAIKRSCFQENNPFL